MAARVVGITLIVLGLALLAGELLGSSAIVFLFWPLAIVAWGLQRVRLGETTFGYSLTAVGLILLLDNILPRQLITNLSDWWPVLLIFLGALIIFGGFTDEGTPHFRVRIVDEGGETTKQDEAEAVEASAESLCARETPSEVTPQSSEETRTGGHEAEAREEHSNEGHSLESKAYPIPPDVTMLVVETEVVAGNFAMKETAGKAIEVRTRTPFVSPMVSLEVRERGGQKVAFLRVGTTIGKESVSLPSIGYWELLIPREFPLEVNAEVSAGRFSFETQGLNLQELKLSSAAGYAEVRFGEVKGRLHVKAENNAGKLVFLVPSNLGIELELENNVGIHNLDRIGLRREANRYSSENLDAFDKKLTGSVENNAGSFEIKYV